MRGKVLRAAAVAFTASGLFFAPAYASKTTSALPPGNPDDVALNTARLFAAYGEPQLALSTLRREAADRGDAGARFTASLLVELGHPATAESLLAAVIFKDGNDDFKNQLVRARLLLDTGRFQASLAVVAAMDSAESLPYAAYRDLVAARAWVGAGQPSRAAPVLERARKNAPEAILDEIDARRIDVYRALKRPREALAAAVDAAGDGDDPVANRKLLKIRFDLASEAGETGVAFEAARELFETARRSTEAEACALAVVRRHDAAKLDTRLLLSCATVLQARAQRDALRSALRYLDPRELSAPQGEEHRLLWGEYHFLNADYSRAIALARPSYSEPALQRRSMLLMARSYKRVGRMAEAATMYEAYARVFPNDGLAAETLYSAASIYESQKRDADRDRVLDQLRHAYPSTFHGWAASMARAQSLDAAGDHADASAIFDQWLTRSRRTDEAALFYSSRQRRAAGDTRGGDALIAELRAVNPYSFYSRMDLLSPGYTRDDSPRGEIRDWMSAASEKRDDAFQRVSARITPVVRVERPGIVASAIERGEFFLVAGFRDWAEEELDVARRHADAADALALARIFDEHAMPWRSVRLYEKTRAGIPWRERAQSAEDFRYLTHPVPYPVQVMSAAGREGIAPYVLYGMMREESLFDTDVVSRAGAVGLMQLMPETARALAKHVDLAPEAGDRLGDPVVNVSIGSWYAADLLRAGDGSVVWMLAAYNAGPSAADQWIRPGVGGDAAIDAVESIDYKETRGYVKRVVEAANVYHDLYFTGSRKDLTPR